MKQLLLCLLLASLCPPASRSAARVTQSPDVSVPEGADLTLRCCWSLNATRLNVTWLKNDTMVTSTKILARAPPDNSSCSTFALTAVGRGAAGSYRCRVVVELPAYGVLEGNGTVVRVQGPPGPPAVTSEGLDVPLELLVPLLLLLLLALLVTLATLHRRRRRTAARVIYEVPHCDSEPADADQRSSGGSSEGSSQWCQVPLYESFDYFEGVREGGTK